MNVAGVYKRKSDRDRKGGKWTAWWIDQNGKRRSKAAATDRAASLEIARKLETEATKIREGLIQPVEITRREARRKPIADHIEDYRLTLQAKGDTKKHARHIAKAVTRLLEDSSARSVVDVVHDRVQEALGRLKAKRSARTANHALGALKAFLRWLYDAGRLEEVPRGIGKLKPYPEKSDRKYVRRALTVAELAKLLDAAAKGPTIITRRQGRGGRPIGWMTGPERAICYRIAMATGFRAEEIRTLMPESFNLDGPEPTITVRACYSKRGKRSGRDDVQPIRRDVAEVLAPFLAACLPGVPVLSVPEKTAEMLQEDLKAAGVECETKAGVIDFHALRHSYITHLVARGVNPKTVQMLARHSTITLTLDRYCHVEDGDVRGALEGE